MKILIVSILCLFSCSLLALNKFDSTYNHVFIQKDPNSSWEKVDPGHPIPAGSQIKTSTDSVARININNVIITLRENTVIKINKITNNIEIDLVNGSIYALSKNEISSFRINSLLAKLDIQSKNFLVKNRNNNLLISVFENKIIAEVKEKQIAVYQGYGLEVTPSFIDLSPFPLPNSPIPEYPVDNSLVTSEITLKWMPISEAVFYRIEIAIDEEFVYLMKSEEVGVNYYTPRDIIQGKYFWRVSSINRKNLEGAFFDYNSFTIQKPKGVVSLEKKKRELEEMMKEDEDDKFLEGESPQNTTTDSLILGGIIILSVIILIAL